MIVGGVLVLSGIGISIAGTVLDNNYNKRSLNQTSSDYIISESYKTHKSEYWEYMKNASIVATVGFVPAVAAKILADSADKDEELAQKLKVFEKEYHLDV